MNSGSCWLTFSVAVGGLVLGDSTVKYPYIWFWGPKGLRVLDRKGKRCRVLCRGRMNSAAIEFEDGYRVVVIRNGIRRLRF